jgi:hypothetical protein
MSTTPSVRLRPDSSRRIVAARSMDRMLPGISLDQLGTAHAQIPRIGAMRTDVGSVAGIGE